MRCGLAKPNPPLRPPSWRIAPSGNRPYALTPDKFDNCFVAFDRFDNGRQGLQCEFDKLSIAYVANSDPEDRWSIAPCGPAKGKVAILGDENAEREMASSQICWSVAASNPRSMT